MLYITTRSKHDTYTSNRALREDRAPDGGLFVPFKLPCYDNEQMNTMAQSGFCETVATVLNAFFSTGLTAWDVECCIGKNAARFHSAGHRVMLCDFWHNPKGSYAYIESMLYKKLCGIDKVDNPTEWAKIAIRIGLLFGIYAMMYNDKVRVFDVAVNAGDFSAPMAILYAKKMGLPVGKLICACNENSAPWDLIQRGSLSTALNTVQTLTPRLDIALPYGLERLIFDAFGYGEVRAYLQAVQDKNTYRIPEDTLSDWNQDIFVYVVGKDRVEPLLSSVYRSNEIILDPYTAVSFGCLRDHRAKFGEGAYTMVLWEFSPVLDYPTIHAATGLNRVQIENYINRI